MNLFKIRFKRLKQTAMFSLVIIKEGFNLLLRCSYRIFLAR